MVFEFHYRGPKVISILITAIFFLLIDLNIDKKINKLLLYVTIILGFISDPFFILVSCAFIISKEILFNKINLLKYANSKNH